MKQKNTQFAPAVAIVFCFLVFGYVFWMLCLSSDAPYPVAPSSLRFGTVAPVPPAQPAAPPPAPPIRVSAVDLVREYAENQVAADQVYRGRVVITDGTIDEITRDVLDQPVLVLSVGSSGIQCTFPSSYSSRIATLKKRQPVAVRGTVTGKAAYVQVDNCRID